MSNGDAQPASGESLGQTIRVVIIEDVRSLREGFWMLIDGTPGFHCTASFRTMEEALEKIGFDLPDVVLVDIGLPGMSGIEGTRLLKQRYPALILLMLTIYEDNDNIFDALCAGASGYLLKKTPPARLLESLQEAMEGGAPMSPRVARRVVTLFRDFRPPGSIAGTKDPLMRHLHLTEQEKQDLIAFLNTLTGEPLSAELMQDTSKH